MVYHRVTWDFCYGILSITAKAIVNQKQENNWLKSISCSCQRTLNNVMSSFVQVEKEIENFHQQSVEDPTVFRTRTIKCLALTSNGKPNCISVVFKELPFPCAVTLSWWEGLCVSMILEAIPTEAFASGRFNLVGQVSG